MLSLTPIIFTYECSSNRRDVLEMRGTAFKIVQTIVINNPRKGNRKTGGEIMFGRIVFETTQIENDVHIAGEIVNHIF